MGLSGCASQYQITETTRSTLATLQPDSARNLLYSYMTKSEKGGGFCIGSLVMSSIYSSHDQLMLDEQGNLEFVGRWHTIYDLQGFTRLEKVDDYPTNVPDHWEAARFKTNLSKIDVIRVKDTSGDFGETFCPGLIPGKLIMVTGENQMGFFINVAPSELDNALAGLLFFSKDAELKEGLGL